jgi:broad specificity phosphatase PhoE
MLNIYLARHGQDEDNAKGILNGHRDKPLTDLGLSQAEQLASYVKDYGLSFAKVYSSPLQRAYVTAKKVTQELSLGEPEILSQLIERDFGIMTGRKISEIEPMCAPAILKTELVTYFLEVEGAETFPDLIVRAKELLTFIKDRHQSGDILLAGHGDFGKMIYAAYYNLAWEEVLRSFHFGNSELVLLSESSGPEQAQIFKTSQFNS